MQTSCTIFNAYQPAYRSEQASKYVVSCHSCHTVAHLPLSPRELAGTSGFDRCQVFLKGRFHSGVLAYCDALPHPEEG